jgi:hypothetical protein
MFFAASASAANATDRAYATCASIDEDAAFPGFHIGKPFRQCRHAALAGRPIAGRDVEQGLRQVVPAQAVRDRLGREIIREQILDGRKSSFRCCVEPVQKIPLVEHHREIGGEFWHYSTPGSVTPLIFA